MSPRVGRRTLLGASLALAFGGEALAQPKPGRAAKDDKPAKRVLAVVGGKVHVGDGRVFEDATVVCEDGLVTKVERGLAAPAGAVVVDAKGLVVTPGLVEGAGQVGLVEIDLERSARDLEEVGADHNRAAFRAADGYNALSTVVAVSRAGGLTSVVAAPSGGLVAGQSAWADLVGSSAQEAIVEGALALHAVIDREGPATSILRLREAFDDARAYAKNKAGYERNQSRKLAASRLDLEALIGSLGGGARGVRRVPVVFHASAASHITSCLSIAKEFGLDPIFAGAQEAWRVADALAKAGAGVLVSPLDNAPSTFHTLGARADAAALLVRAGVKTAIATFGAHDARKLRQLAGNAVRAGLPHEAALECITRAPARIFGMDARYGTVEPKKVANLVVWSGDPLELSTRVRAVVVRGEKASLENRQTALLARYR